MSLSGRFGGGRGPVDRIRCTGTGNKHEESSIFNRWNAHDICWKRWDDPLLGNSTRKRKRIFRRVKRQFVEAFVARRWVIIFPCHLCTSGDSVQKGGFATEFFEFFSLVFSVDSAAELVFALGSSGIIPSLHQIRLSNCEHRMTESAIQSILLTRQQSWSTHGCFITQPGSPGSDDMFWKEFRSSFLPQKRTLPPAGLGKSSIIRILPPPNAWPGHLNFSSLSLGNNSRGMTA